MPRPVKVSVSSLGPDELMLLRMRGKEELGRMFRYDLELVSYNHAIDPKKILGESMTVHLENEDGSFGRYFHGRVVSFNRIGWSEGFERYEAVLCPDLWFMTQSSRTRSFLDEKTSDVLQSLFSEYGLRNSVAASKINWDYRMQYCETDFDFASRLMEEVGMYYHFEHSDRSHTIKVVAQNGDLPSPITIPFFAPELHGAWRDNCIYEWSVFNTVGPKKVDAWDYDETKKKQVIQNEVSSTALSHSGSPQKFHLHGQHSPGTNGIPQAAKSVAKARLEELRVPCKSIRGATSHRGINAGTTFKLENHPISAENAEYVIVSAEFELTTSHYTSHIDEEEEPTYTCNFRAIPRDVEFSPQRLTPKPQIFGALPAIVVDTDDPDKRCRAKVKFFCNPEILSWWARVIQTRMSDEGTLVTKDIPAINDEVMVQFVEGDPDRPIIIGRAVNGVDTIDRFDAGGVFPERYHSCHGVFDSENEMVFDHKEGNGQVYLGTKGVLKRRIDHDEYVNIGVAKESGAYKMDAATEPEKKGKGGSQYVDIKQDRSVTVQKGDDTLDIESGKRTVTAAKSIELIVGQSSIKIEPSKITLKSTQIVIDGAMKVDVKSTNTTVKGDAMVTVKGGVVQIN